MKSLPLSLICGLMTSAGLAAYAAEPICPGGSSPRSDITWCADFDDTTNCVTGNETQCWADNASSNKSGVIWDLDQMPPQMQILKSGADGKSAVGGGFVRGHMAGGSTGTDYGGPSNPAGFPTSAVNYRWYFKLGKTFESYGNFHGPAVTSNSCGMAPNFEPSPIHPYMYVPNWCKVGSYDLEPNVFRPVLQNGVWHVIELRQVVDSACSNPSDPHGCNGVFQGWIDGRLAFDYSDINWGGATDGVRWNGYRSFNSYYHVGAPPFGMDIYYDNMALSNNGTYIGPAADENPLGVADAASPYMNEIGMEGFIGHKIGGDCHSAGGRPFGIDYANALSVQGTLQSNITHGLLVGSCSPSVDLALQIDLTSSSGNGGVWLEEMYSNFIFPSRTVNAWIYLPSSNPVSAGPIALSGYKSYACSSSACGDVGSYVALGISNGKWAVVQRDSLGTANVVAASPVSVSSDKWHQFELMVWRDKTASLMIDGARLFNRVTLPDDVSYIFGNPNRASNPGTVLGVADYEGPGTFTMYLDDALVGSASFWSCDGWNPANCPFGMPPPVALAPAKPRALALR